MEAEDSFIHGVIQGSGGTCGNMPIIYTAVGRRMGYPLYLSSTLRHGFCQWVDGIERINIEASGQGISFFDDDYYRTGRYEMEPEQVRECGYIQPLNGRETLASFMLQRGLCFATEKMYTEAVTAMAWANELDPSRWQHGYCIQETMTQWSDSLRNQLPKQFPKLDIGLPQSQFLNLPSHVEMELIGLRLADHLLRDPRLQAKWWTPLKNGVRPADLPATMRMNYRWNQPGRKATI